MYFLIMKDSTCKKRDQIFHMNIPIPIMYIYLIQKLLQFN